MGGGYVSVYGAYRMCGEVGEGELKSEDVYKRQVTIRGALSCVAGSSLYGFLSA